MDFDGLDRQLRDSLADLKLSNEERDELRQLGSELAPDQVRFLRNRAFDLVRELVLLEEQGERIAGCPGGVFRPASPDTGAQKKLPALIPPGGQHVVQVAPTDQRP